MAQETHVGSVTDQGQKEQKASLQCPCVFAKSPPDCPIAASPFPDRQYADFVVVVVQLKRIASCSPSAPPGDPLKAC